MASGYHINTEEMSSAGRTMMQAAASMRQAAASMDGTFAANQRWLDNFQSIFFSEVDKRLDRLEQMLKEAKGEPERGSTGVSAASSGNEPG